MKSLKNAFLILSLFASVQIMSMEQPPQGPGKVNWPTGESIPQKTFIEKYRKDIQDLGAITAGVATYNIAPRYYSSRQLTSMGAATLLGIFSPGLIKPYLRSANSRLFPEEAEAADAAKKFQKAVAGMQLQQEKKD